MSDQRGTRTGEQPPISAHPAFPVIVALWFAALLGLGSLVLPAVLLERMVAASGLASLVGAAQPPLGITARIVTALVATAAGAIVGVLIARRVVAANTPKPASSQAPTRPQAASAKRPISAHEELDAAGFDGSAPEPGPAAAAGRRRALAVADQGPQGEFLDFAPLPGQPFGQDEPLDLEAFVVSEPEPAPERDREPGAAPTVWPDSPPADAKALFRSAAPSEQTPFASPAESAMPTPVGESSDLAAESLEPAQAPDRPLGELAMIDLVDRFARALQRHQARGETRADPPEAQPAPPVQPRPASAAVPPAPEAGPPASRIPAALRPVDLDVDDDDETEEVAGAGYPSLLTMKSALGAARAPVRIDDEDARDCEAPAPSPPPTRPVTPIRSSDPGEAERALREALAKLQSLSGAA